MDNLPKFQAQASLFDDGSYDAYPLQASPPISDTCSPIREATIALADQYEVLSEKVRDSPASVITSVEIPESQIEASITTVEHEDQVPSNTKTREKKGRKEPEEANVFRFGKIPGKYLVVPLSDLQTPTPAAKKLEPMLAKFEYIAKMLLPLAFWALRRLLVLHPIVITRKSSQTQIVAGFRMLSLAHLIAPPKSEVLVVDLFQATEDDQDEFALSDYLFTGLFFSLSPFSVRQLLRFFSTAPAEMIETAKRLMPGVSSNKAFEKITGINESTIYRDEGKPSSAEIETVQHKERK